MVAKALQCLHSRVETFSGLQGNLEVGLSHADGFSLFGKARTAWPTPLLACSCHAKRICCLKVFLLFLWRDVRVRVHRQTLFFRHTSGTMGRGDPVDVSQSKVVSDILTGTSSILRPVIAVL